VIEFISTKTGVVLVVLAVMHYFNIINFARLRQKRHNKLAATTNHNGGNGGQNLPQTPPKRERSQTLDTHPVRAQAHSVINRLLCCRPTTQPANRIRITGMMRET
jgi:hypothetical protein